MPMASTPKEFADALVERRSRTTKALDALFRRPRDLRGVPNVDELRSARYLDADLKKWVRGILRQKGVKKNIEFTHINDWPKNQKEAVRKAMVHAIDYDVRIEFFWALWDDRREGTIIEPDPLPADGKITITFYSPQTKVRSSGGNIFVDV